MWKSFIYCKIQFFLLSVLTSSGLGFWSESLFVCLTGTQLLSLEILLYDIYLFIRVWLPTCTTLFLDNIFHQGQIQITQQNFNLTIRRAVKKERKNWNFVPLSVTLPPNHPHPAPNTEQPLLIFLKDLFKKTSAPFTFVLHKGVIHFSNPFLTSKIYAAFSWKIMASEVRY